MVGKGIVLLAAGPGVRYLFLFAKSLALLSHAKRYHTPDPV